MLLYLFMVKPLTFVQIWLCFDRMFNFLWTIDCESEQLSQDKNYCILDKLNPFPLIVYWKFILKLLLKIK